MRFDATVAAIARAAVMCSPSSGISGTSSRDGGSGARPEALDELVEHATHGALWPALVGDDDVRRLEKPLEHGQLVCADARPGLDALDEDLGVIRHEPLRCARDGDDAVAAEAPLAGEVVGDVAELARDPDRRSAALLAPPSHSVGDAVCGHVLHDGAEAVARAAQVQDFLHRA